MPKYGAEEPTINNLYITKKWKLHNYRFNLTHFKVVGAISDNCS